MASSESSKVTNVATSSQSSGIAEPRVSSSLTQRMALWKQQVRSLPRHKKIEKLAVYSSCKVRKTQILTVKFNV